MLGVQQRGAAAAADTEPVFAKKRKFEPQNMRQRKKP
jgi:hypothetical protein